MIIYYHCTRDSALLLSFLLTCHPYIPFHEMIFILVYHKLRWIKKTVWLVLGSMIFATKKHVYIPSNIFYVIQIV